MKNKKILLPLLLLALLFVWFLIPGCADYAGDASGGGLRLLTPAPGEPLVKETAAPSTAVPGTAAPSTAMPGTAVPSTAVPVREEKSVPDENGSYSGKDEVALYIYTYGHLPSNYITKKEAQSAGWSGGPLDRILPGMSIGGDYFGNYEGQLPKARGRRYTECDIDTVGARSRGSKRIIFSNDGLIYYTPDHYESFELLYGNPG